MAFGKLFAGVVPQPNNRTFNFPFPIASSDSNQTYEEDGRGAGSVVLAIIMFLCFLVCVIGALTLLLGLSIGMIIRIRRT